MSVSAGAGHDTRLSPAPHSSVQRVSQSVAIKYRNCIDPITQSNIGDDVI